MDEDALLDPALEARRALDPHARICGNCRIWTPRLQDGQGRWVGPCRLQPDRGDFPGTAPVCERFLPRSEKLPSAPPPEPGRRRSRTLSSTGPVLRRGGTAQPLAGRPAPRPLRPDVDVDLGDLSDMTRTELLDIIREALEDQDRLPELAPRWEGGTVVLKPGNDSQPREVPLDALLHKIVGIRDRLRVLEAKINGHSGLSDAEKVDLQGYITRCYGSLTTFNLLFKHEEDRFHGMGKE